MNLKQITPGTKTQSVVVTEPAIIHVIPEFGNTLFSSIDNSGLRLHNCAGVISKTGMYRLGAKTINARKTFIDTKKHLSKATDNRKSLRVYDDLPTESLVDAAKSNKKYFIVDHTIDIKLTEYMCNLTSIKRGVFFFLQQLKKQFSHLKPKYPGFEHNLLFCVGPTRPENSLVDILQKLHTLPPNKLNDIGNIFDKYALTSVATNENPIVMPVMYYDSKGKIKIHKVNIDKIAKLLERDDDKVMSQMMTDPEDDNIVISRGDKLSDDKVSLFRQQIKKKDFGSEDDIKKLARDIQSTAKVNKSTTVDSRKQDTITKLDVNKRQLSKIFKKYKIEDDVVVENIKQALDSYVNENKDTELTKENLEKVVLLAIYKLLFNEDEIPQEYLDHPAKLFQKLQEVNTYSKNISYPKSRQNALIEAGEVIDLNRVTGVVRHEYEFSNQIHRNVRQLFKSLEGSKTNPIKIVSIKHNFSDNDLDRVINYDITIKNTTGGHTKPYTVSLKVPALVNDRYFKLNGKHYILANQQYFVPLTKHKHEECRLLTAYSIMTLSVVNMKFAVTELHKFIEYIENNYPEAIISVTREKKKIIAATLKTEKGEQCNISLYGKDIFSSDKESMHSEDGKLIVTYKDDNGEHEHELTIGKSEYLYDKLLQIAQSHNPSENVNKSPKSIPYIQMFIQGIKIPFIVYLWQQLGLPSALMKFGVDYSIGDKYPKDEQRQVISFPLDNGKTLYMFPESRRELLFVNGLKTIDQRKYKFTENDISDRHSIDSFINDKNGTRGTYNLDLFTENEIDPITKEMLEYQDRPSDIINLMSSDMMDKLFNDQPDSYTDLKNYRSRQSEMMFHLMYKQIMQAHNTYRNEIKFGNEDAKLFLKSDYIIQCLLGVHPDQKGNAALEQSISFSPVNELRTAAKTIKTGPGGLDNKRSIKKEHRNIHPSYYGNIGANATGEYDPGVANHMTLTTLLSNKFGSYGHKDITNANGWDIVTLDEALIPFVNELDASRAMLAWTHRAQTMPVKDGDIPLVSTGAENIITQLASSKFLQRAKKKGKIVDVVENDYVKVEYEDGKTEYLDITPRLSSTKRSSFVNLRMNTLKVGETFSQNEPVAWTDNFNDGTYVCGKNLKMAVMNYMGFSFEDGYVVSRDAANTFETEVVEERSIIVPLNTKLHKIITKTKDTDEDEVLLEFSYAGDLDEYLTMQELIDSEDEEESIAMFAHIENKIQLKSPGGEISDIRIYINNRNSVDPTIIDAWKEITKQLKQKSKRYAYGKTNEKDKLASIDNLDMSQLKTGTHKHRGNLFEGAKISYYIRKKKVLDHGDKMCNRFGAKGVITKVIEPEETPHTEYTGNIDIFISPISVLGRKNLNVVKELYVGKILFNLPDIMSKKASSRISTPKSLRALILNVYDQLDNTKDKKYYNAVLKKINSINDAALRKMLIDKKLKFNLIIEPFVNIPMNDIIGAAKSLDIPLEEYVYIPETKTWTKTPVPVGIQYMSSMEQLAQDYESLRSTAGYTSITGQPKKGRANMGGQSVGYLDIFNILQFDTPSVVEELMTVRSDDFRSKRTVVNDIIQNGSAKMPDKTGNAGTKNLYRVHMIGMGLRPTS